MHTHKFSQWRSAIYMYIVYRTIRTMRVLFSCLVFVHFAKQHTVNRDMEIYMTKKLYTIYIVYIIIYNYIYIYTKLSNEPQKTETCSCTMYIVHHMNIQCS